MDEPHDDVDARVAQLAELEAAVTAAHQRTGGDLGVFDQSMVDGFEARSVLGGAVNRRNAARAAIIPALLGERRELKAEVTRLKKLVAVKDRQIECVLADAAVRPGTAQSASTSAYAVAIERIRGIVSALAAERQCGDLPAGELAAHFQPHSFEKAAVDWLQLRGSGPDPGPFDDYLRAKIAAGETE